MVGLPYPDLKDPVLREKMQSMDRAAQRSGLATTTTTTTTATHTSVISGNSYYHNLCMRAVNQSIGRAIRHASDYAAILLLDVRYETDDRVWSSLPAWLKQGCCNNCDDHSARATTSRASPPCPFAQKLEHMHNFFRDKTTPLQQQHQQQQKGQSKNSCL